jgi:hypothetical protein
MRYPRSSGRPESDQAYLRLTTFRPLVPPYELDQWLRRAVAAYTAQPAHIWTCVGRRAVGATDEHTLASVWSSRSGHDEAIGTSAVRDLETDAQRMVADAVTELLPLRIGEVFPRDRPMTILRVFRGRTHAGQRDAYLTEAELGTAADGRRPDGPGAIACATLGADDFVTASVWADWPSIEACTGGDIHRPLTTRNATRIAAGGPTHYEIVTFELRSTEPARSM